MRLEKSAKKTIRDKLPQCNLIKKTKQIKEHELVFISQTEMWNNVLMRRPRPLQVKPIRLFMCY